MEYLRQTSDELDALEESDIPEEIEKKMDRDFQQLCKRVQSHKRQNKFWRYTRRAGLAACLVICTFTALFYVNADVRSEISNFLIQNFNNFSLISYDENSNAAKPFGWRMPQYPQWVPDDYRYGELSLSDSMDTIWYDSPVRNSLTFSVLPAGQPVNFDSEDTICQSAAVLDYSANLYTKQDGTKRILVILTSDVTILIQGNITEDEIFRIAQQIANL